MGEFLKTKHFTIINNSNNESVIVNNEISELPIEYPCPEYITALLSSINNKLGIAYWNKYQKYYESPFENTGNSFKNNVFEVNSYDWDNEENQEYNFKCGEIKISWYKYLGRGMLINGKYNSDEIINMYNKCMESIDELEDKYV